MECALHVKTFGVRWGMPAAYTGASPWRWKKIVLIRKEPGNHWQLSLSYVVPPCNLICALRGKWTLFITRYHDRRRNRSCASRTNEIPAFEYHDAHRISGDRALLIQMTKSRLHLMNSDSISKLSHFLLVVISRKAASGSET